ncbi:MAG: hypothetical protein JRI59_11195 [Deltaproteobacteria bacterium]|nr:hypothetical protein [Deltaproteobacteria bacterium]
MLFKNLEYWVLVQLALDVGLLILVLVFLNKIRTLSRWLQDPHLGEGRAAGIPSLQQQIAALQHRLDNWGSPPSGRGLNESAAADTPPNPEPASCRPDPGQRKSLRAQVEELARQGWPPEEIARHLRLQLAEVQLALDLSKMLAR